MKRKMYIKTYVIIGKSSLTTACFFADDYSLDGVRLAVERFAKEERRQVSFVADKWILRKRDASNQSAEQQ